MNQTRCVLLALFFSATLALSQSQFAEFPFGQRNSISPDGYFTLKTKGCQPNPIKCDRRLWLVNNRAHGRKLLIDVQRTARVGWAPSGSTFFLNDDLVSDESRAYLYFPAECIFAGWRGNIPSDWTSSIDAGSTRRARGRGV